MSGQEGNGYSTAMSPASDSIPTLDVVQVVAATCRPEMCEMPLHIGLFFDGTGNNYSWVESGATGTQEDRKKDSNVYRLYWAYPQENLDGYYPMYIPGVGTPFPQIGEESDSSTGMGFGAGGDGRINYGLLHVLNSVHRAVSRGSYLFDDGTIMALCRNGKRQYNPRLGYAPLKGSGDAAALQKVGMGTSGGLLRGGGVGDRQRIEFLTQWASKIAERVNDRKTKPKLTEIFIDVFGFSRGAAEARVFCNWLLQIMQGGKLCGVKATIRFLGIFDTVASVGMPLSTPMVGGWTDGHLDWAKAEFLRIDSRVENCVHHIAMHENRASFPLDYVQAPGSTTLPGNCRQYAFPGMHSDVGGGYTPDDQGRGYGKLDSRKLSQIPLNYMYRAAEAAGVPLDKESAKLRTATEESVDPFEIHPDLQAAYDAFIAAQPAQGSQRAWLLPYLAWRYQVRDTYARLPWRNHASAGDVADLEGANATLLRDIAALDGTDTFGEKVWDSVLDMSPLTSPLSHTRDLSKLAPEAREVLKAIREQRPVSPAEARMFGEFAHDSYAGFKPFDGYILGFIPIPGTWEPEGYLRYRRWYAGDDKQMAQNQQTSQSEEMVA